VTNLLREMVKDDIGGSVGAGVGGGGAGFSAGVSPLAGCFFLAMTPQEEYLGEYLQCGCSCCCRQNLEYLAGDLQRKLILTPETREKLSRHMPILDLELATTSSFLTHLPA
jgi:hypothetical protein